MLSPNILLTLWEKWVFLATLAGMTTLMRGSVGQIVATRDGEAMTRQLFEECLAVASASRIEIPAPARHKALKMLTMRGSAFTASMLRDLLAGQRTEHRHILGNMLERAAAARVATPILALAFCQMEIREQETAKTA